MIDAKRENKREFRVGDLVFIARGFCNWTPSDENGIQVNVGTVRRVEEDSIIVSFDAVDSENTWTYMKSFAVILEGVPAPFRLSN